MNRLSALAAVLVVVLSAPFRLLPQNPPASPPLPSDPVALLKLASQVNGLHGDDLQPWHLHATWQTLQKGEVQNQGSYEEWWASPKKFKIAYTAKDYQQVLYVTDHGPLLSGSKDTPDLVFSDLVQMVDQPLPEVKFVKKRQWKTVVHQQGKVTVTCAAANWNPPLPQYCFADQLPALRVFTQPWESTAWNSIVLFQGRYLGEVIRIVRSNSPEIDIKIDRLEELNPVMESEFVPTADATPAGDRPIFVPGSRISGTRLGGLQPEYPAIAKAEHVQGTVLMVGTILKDGSMSDLRVLSGPVMLQQAAFDAVRTWRYRPYLLNGEPVLVKTQIRVVFSLGR